MLAQAVRPDSASTLEYFRQQGVTVKVISGDDPRTVGAIASRLGLDQADHPVDARALPDADAEGTGFADAVAGNSVFGRVTPHQKRQMVGALQAGGRTVAMTGDGVNDVLALKDADVGVAMGSGSDATRSVAQLVLLDNRFAVLPDVVAEGRKVIGNIERVAKLFLTKTVYGALMAVAVGIAQLPFPFLPRHLTLVTALTIGTPAFVLALAPNKDLVAPNMVARVLRFSIPAGIIATICSFGSYLVARVDTALDARAGPHDGHDRPVHRRPRGARRRRPTAGAVEGRADRGDGGRLRAGAGHPVRARLLRPRADEPRSTRG